MEKIKATFLFGTKTNKWFFKLCDYDISSFSLTGGAHPFLFSLIVILRVLFPLLHWKILGRKGISFLFVFIMLCHMTLLIFKKKTLRNINEGWSSTTEHQVETKISSFILGMKYSLGMLLASLWARGSVLLLAHGPFNCSTRSPVALPLNRWGRSSVGGALAAQSF